jgi:putative ABC transport system permease protein
MSDPTSPQATGEARGSHTRFARWRASWRVALRMARRDVRRYKGRSALVLAMVTIPVALLVAAVCWVGIGGVHGEDLIPLQMGVGQALIQEPQEYAVAQTAEADMSWGDDAPAKSVPGYVLGREGAGVLERNTKALQRLVGGALIPVAEADARYVTGERRVRIQGLLIDGRAADLGAKAELTSGRWPRDETEILVTEAGVDKGMPNKGTIVVSLGGREREVEVVGTAAALSAWGSPPDFVAPGGWGMQGTWGQAWILLRDEPVLWPEVRSLNEYGIMVASAAVLRDPPGRSELDPRILESLDREKDVIRQMSALGAVALFLAVTLLVAPAFAVGAARQRRTLALAACNGAETWQLRRSVLAQAVILGVAAAVGGAVMGAGGLDIAIGVWRSTHPDTTVGSFTVPWLAVTIVVACAALSTLTAALLPSLRLGRLDIVGVMRGQNVSPPASRRLPVVGALLLVGGGAFLVYSMRSGLDERFSAAGAVVLVLGALLTVPTLLVAAGALAARLPVAARMATRDAARHRSRSTPTVAAILAGVAVLTTMSVALLSDTEKQVREYLPQTLKGEGYVMWVGEAANTNGEAKRVVARTLRREAPDLLQTPLLVVRRNEGQLEPEERRPFVAAVPPGSTVESSLNSRDESGWGRTLGTEYGYYGSVIALPVAELARRLDLSIEERRILAQGGIATIHATLIHDGMLDIATGTWREDPQTGRYVDVVVDDRTSMPAVALPASSAKTGALPSIDNGTGAVVTVATARRLGWPLMWVGVLLRDPDGAIDADLPWTLDEYLADDAYGYVEQGFARNDKLVMAVISGLVATLLLAVTLIATALSLAEQQSDMGTFAAVGATRGTRRRFAAALAITVGLVGAVLGMVVGLFAGVAVAYPLTAKTWDHMTGMQVASDPALAVPWLPLLAVVVGVPLLAGALAAAAVRRAPAMTRRAD